MSSDMASSVFDQLNIPYANTIRRFDGSSHTVIDTEIRDNMRTIHMAEYRTEQIIDSVREKINYLESKLESLHVSPIVVMMSNRINDLELRVKQLEAEKRAKRDKQIKQKNTRNNLNNTKNNTKEDILKKPYGY
jgi:hypothetical protein